jgi:hypothetical protein
MSNTTPTPAHAAGPGNDSHLTVEDAGTTTDPSDLVDDDASDRGGRAGGADRDGLASPAGDDSIGHVFDQTNGIVEGLDGDSDGSAEGDELSSAERADEDGTLDGAERLGGDIDVAHRGDPNP